LRGDNKNVVFHSINPADALFQDALASYKFDFVIYISTREEQLATESNNIGQQLDGLRNTLGLCTKENVKRFFYVSSTEVYGNMLDSSENVEPQPSSLNGYTLLTGEQYCMFYHNELGLKTTILRLTHVYGPDEHYGLLYRIVQECNNQGKVILPANPDTLSSFLHVEDVVDFLKRAMDEEIGKEAQIVNLSSANPISFSTLAQSLIKHFPEVEFDFDSEKRIFTRPATVVTAKRVFGWLDLHDLRSGLENYIELAIQKPVSKPSSLKMAFNKLSGYPEILKWVELILGAGLAHYFSELTTILIQFKYVDFRLLFVVVMGSLYGIQFGLWASLLVSLSILYGWYQLGFDWALLVYNVGNWFPFALYFLAGLITGFNRDKTESSLLHEQKQSNLIYEKYVFLYGVFDEIRKLKDEFREQLIGYRDSFGKIYSITRELDASQEQAVYFKALSIIEELMQSSSIAIYSLEGEYARLEVNSYALNEKVSKSLKLSDFPELLHHITRGVIFQNTALLPSYPPMLPRYLITPIL
jgi:UDP-glucose 4-epimerase